MTDNVSADTLFQQDLPTGNYDMSMFIQVTSPDPSVSAILSSAQIPGPANGGKGQNDWWYSNSKADDLMKSSDSELDNSKRADQIHSLDKILADDNLNLPLYPFPSLLAWRTDKLAGPVTEFINNPESNLWNLWDWSLK